MRKAHRKIHKRRKALALLGKLMDTSEHVTVIHYSCESFYDRPDGTSPRITSIAVRNLESGQANSFSIHLMGERKGYAAAQIEERYNELERDMLAEFYGYVRKHSNGHWLHWNMRNNDYGFQAIAHRYRVLGGSPEEINEAHLANLADLLSHIYGGHYAQHPRLPAITKKNGITDKDYLLGAEEAEAFNNRDYVRLHRSTLRKVEIIAELAERTENGSLKTDASWKEIYGAYHIGLSEFIREHWTTTIIMLVAAVASIAALFLGLFR
jgi:hypothetical protein